MLQKPKHYLPYFCNNYAILALKFKKGKYKFTLMKQKKHFSTSDQLS